MQIANLSDHVPWFLVPTQFSGTLEPRIIQRFTSAHQDLIVKELPIQNHIYRLSFLLKVKYNIGEIFENDVGVFNSVSALYSVLGNVVSWYNSVKSVPWGVHLIRRRDPAKVSVYLSEST